MSPGASTQRPRISIAAIYTLLWFWPAFGVLADRQSVRQGYASPEEAAAALASAARSHDQAALSEIFGTGSEKLLSSGDRRMTDGFALIAWPAIFGSSGIMTFQVDQDGVVFQKDLGTSTSRIASRITQFDPDPTWARVEITDQ